MTARPQNAAPGAWWCCGRWLASSPATKTDKAETMMKGRVAVSVGEVVERDGYAYADLVKA